MQPIWGGEGEGEGDISNMGDSKRLSKLPSLSPVRVSPDFLINQIPSTFITQDKVIDNNNDTPN